MTSTCEQYFNKLWTTTWFNLMRRYNIKLREMCANPNFQLSFANDYEIYYATELSKNPNLTLEFILAHPTSKWDWNEISKHPNITMEMIDAHPEFLWNTCSIACNPNFTREYHDKLMEQFENIPTEKYQLSFCSKYAIRRDDVALLNEKIQQHTIHSNQFTEENLEIIFEHAKNVNVTLDSRHLANNGMRNISTKFVEKHIDQPWYWYNMHLCHDFTMDFVFKNPQQQWQWFAIVEHRAFTYQHLAHIPFSQVIDIQHFTEHFVMYNPNATYDVVKCMNPEIINKWKCWSGYANLLDITKNHPIDLCKYPHQSANENITLYYLTSNANKLWKWKTLAKNPLDRCKWVNRRTMQVIIAVLLEYHEMVYSTSCVENVFCNDYLVMNVMRFL